MFERTLNNTDKRYIIVLSIIIICITVFPYVYGYAHAPEQSIFTGLHNFTTGDTATYYSFIEQAKQGDILFKNLYTSEIQDNVLFSPLWLLLGNIARVFNLSAPLVFHLGRVLLIPFLVFAIFKIVAFFLPSQKMRFWTTTLIVFSGGIGSAFGASIHGEFPNIPTDLWVPESLTFLTMYHSPLLVASLTLLITTFYLFIKGFTSKQLQYMIWAGISGIGLFVLHPFYVPTIFAVTGVWAIMKVYKKEISLSSGLRLYIPFFGISISVLAYYIWLYITQDVLRAWAMGNILSSPSVEYYLIGFGLLIPLAIIGGIKKRSDSFIQLIIAWVIVNAILLYAPFDFQRRLIEGIHIPLGILATIGLVTFFKYVKSKIGYAAYSVVIVVGVFLLINSFVAVIHDIDLYNSTEAYPFYIPNSDYQAMVWLQKNTDKDAIILSGFNLDGNNITQWTGNMIPGFTGRTVYLGHIPQTIDFMSKQQDVYLFFTQETTNNWRKTFLIEKDIDYVFFESGTLDSTIFDPESVIFLNEVFSDNRASVYKVIK